MNVSETETCTLDSTTAKIAPTAVVIFGATGDLTQRKIIPAFYHLQKNCQIPDGCAIIGYARRPKTDEEFRCELKTSLDQFSHTQPVDDAVWRQLAPHIYYHQADIESPDGYRTLAERLQRLPESAAFGGNCLFYLATAPNYFGTIAENLGRAGLAPREDSRDVRRLIVEKPFGEDLTSARRLNQSLHQFFPEKAIFRIDHYLGKETVQNLLYFRFGNSIYEPLWNRRYIDHIQITVAEKIGVGARGGYYDAAGATRDMLQNHLFQLLTLIAMEPPASLDAESIRDEKVKVLRSIPISKPEELLKRSVRAQYGDGLLDGQHISAYRKEQRVAPDSTTETYVALRLEVDNWRWAGVPFYLRTGKGLYRQFTEINVVYHRPPAVLFAAICGPKLRRNCLRIRIQPGEGIHLNFNAKVPGKSMIQLVDMNFRYREDFSDYLPEAYERLMVDALIGESTLFTRRDEVEQAWQWVDRLHDAWAGENRKDLPLYPFGSMGPDEADHLLNRDGRYWAPVLDD
ncbi:MAG: glucose-6-phosphate dehydrogenase [Verrucomicrobia bacterium]|nr:glucose-6-phosphate dehydrogenase [Verrucomicrobiota bacterium]